LPAFPGTLLARAIDAAIQACSKSHSQIKIKITDARGAGLIELLQQKAIDFAFVQILPTGSTLKSQTLFTEHLMLVGDKKLLKGVEKIKSAASLSKYPLIFQTARGSMRTLLETACANEGYSFTPTFEIDSIALQLQLCLTGQGACILPASACIGNDFLQKLSYVPISIPGVSRSLYMVQNASYLSPQAGLVSDLLGSHIQDQAKRISSTKLIRLSTH
jgi:DNA-binding transcriptional LysR family regulator